MAGAKGPDQYGRGPRKSHGVKRSETDGGQDDGSARISQKKQDEEIRRSLKLGLTKPPTGHRSQYLIFARGHQPAFAGITFMKAPYCEDIRKIGNFEAAFVGAPFDLGHHLPSGNAVRTAGGAAHLRALRRLLVRRRRLFSRSSIFAMPATSSSFGNIEKTSTR